MKGGDRIDRQKSRLTTYQEEDMSDGEGIVIDLEIQSSEEKHIHPKMIGN